MASQPLFYVQKNLGAVQIDPQSPRVQFSLFFPAGADHRIKSITVIGDFQSKIGSQDWNLHDPVPLVKSNILEGEIWKASPQIDLSPGFYEYKYLVTFADGTIREATDPCARYSGRRYDYERRNDCGRRKDCSGFVIGGISPEQNRVTPLMERKPLRDLCVYELHALDFTQEYRGLRAPLDAIRDKLNYLVDLGINAILIMPWTAWKDEQFDWGYVPFQYFAVEYAYYNDMNSNEEKLSWLKRLISACHEKNIHVIMDGVFNHCDENFPYKKFYLNQADCPYTAESFGGVFPGLQDLDFAQQCTQDFIRDVCLYWISVFSIDGIRFDNTVNYYVPGDKRGLPELLQSIQDYVVADGQKNFSMTLEHLDLDAAALVSGSAATSYWDDGLFRECTNHLLYGSISPKYLASLNNSQYVSSLHPEKVATLYLSNHDHSTVASSTGIGQGKGSELWYRAQPHVIALLTSSGCPLISAGQEFAEDYRIPEDDEGTGRRIRSRPLRWKGVDDAYGSKMLSLHKKLFKLRNEHPALRSGNFYPPKWEDWMTRFDENGFGVDTSRNLVVYHRWGVGSDGVVERFYIALNFSDTDHTVTLQTAENGIWYDVLSDTNVTVDNFRVDLTVEKNWGHILFKRSS